MNARASGSPFPQLVRNAEPEELIQAAIENHRSWFSENAAVAFGGETVRENGLTAVYTPASAPDAPGEVIWAFPRMEDAEADEAIDAALTYARQRKVRQVSCWSHVPTEPDDLAARLVARGFQWGWQPHWMALDLFKIPPADFPVSAALHIAEDEESAWEVDGLPYYDRADAPRFRVHARQMPRCTYHFGARIEGEIVGHSLLHISTGTRGVAGLYSVGVVPSAREQGVGRAVSLAACQFARQQGCRYVLLNAATHIYERLGFVSLGHGQTWWIYQTALDSLPIAPDLVAFTEAVGRGDTASLPSLPPPADLDAVLVCGMTPLEVAARLKQPQAAQWLINRGASPDVIPLLDLGWRDRIPALLAARPALANRRVGEWGQTPLHEAIARNDTELARLLLSVRPDLSINDAQFNATPLGWAQHFGRTEIIEMIEAQSTL